MKAWTTWAEKSTLRPMQTMMTVQVTVSIFRSEK
jgi:hypothetical protein